uniref:Uncharacterized protein n=1 Tax=Romanomermis culicivorax TaxID=13658 RepID=A0A915K845_ROMCU
MGRYFNCWRLTSGGQSYSSNRSTVGAAQSEPILVQNHYVIHSIECQFMKPLSELLRRRKTPI